MVVTVEELCPSCTLRTIDTPSGLCSVCIVDHAADAYTSQDRIRASVRSASWERRARPDAPLAALRQRRKRLIELIRPRRASSSAADPWEIAAIAIRQLRSLHVSRTQLSHVEQIVEAVRRLAWGPDVEEEQDWITHRSHRLPKNYPGQLQLWKDEEVVAA